MPESTAAESMVTDRMVTGVYNRGNLEAGKLLPTRKGVPYLTVSGT